MRRITGNQTDQFGASTSRRRRRLATVAVALAGTAMATAVACEPSVVVVDSPAPAPARIGVLRVDVVGDSLVRQSTPDLELALRGSGLEFSISSQPGVDITTPFVQTNLARVAGGPADIVVLATSSNDVQWEAKATEAFGPIAAQQAYRGHLAEAIARMGNRCVVVVNSREDVAPMYRPDQAFILNTNLRNEVAGRSNVALVDWAATSKGHRDDWFVGDLLHFGDDVHSATGTKAGAPAYAAAILSGVQSCRAKLSPA